MQIAVICHTEMVEQFIMLRAAVSTAMECMLRCSPTEALWVDIVDELVAEFQKQEQQCLCLEKSGVRVCDLILGPPSNWVRLADQLVETVGQL
jgi:hypothetical protein